VIETADDLLWEITPGDHDVLGPRHEDGLTPRVLDLLPEGGVFLDVGAHVGHYTLRAARKAFLVIAVEPNPSTAERLRHNIQLNDLRNVLVTEIAAWNGTERFRIERVHECYERDGSGRIVPDKDGLIWGGRLDEVLARFPLRPDRLDLVKLDVEGADLRALAGMSGLLARHGPVLFIEDHSAYGYYQQEDLAAAIHGLGYHAEEVTWEGSTWWIARPAPAPSTPA
jgi:FkbM family methyltransferase